MLWSLSLFLFPQFRNWMSSRYPSTQVEVWFCVSLPAMKICHQQCPRWLLCRIPFVPVNIFFFYIRRSGSINIEKLTRGNTSFTFYKKVNIDWPFYISKYSQHDYLYWLLHLDLFFYLRVSEFPQHGLSFRLTLIVANVSSPDNSLSIVRQNTWLNRCRRLIKLLPNEMICKFLALLQKHLTKTYFSVQRTHSSVNFTELK